MELQGFIKNLADQFDDAHISQISSKTKFRDIEGYSSLIALSIIAMADEEYSVRLRGDDIRNAVTVEDLFNLVKSRT
ncbi:MAG: acyl carrier protein [Odoribacter sp.]|nr:acyl carrier protein [Odoribacter sp.]